MLSCEVANVDDLRWEALLISRVTYIMQDDYNYGNPTAALQTCLTTTVESF